MITYFGKNRCKRDWHKFGASYGHQRDWKISDLLSVSLSGRKTHTHTHTERETHPSELKHGTECKSKREYQMELKPFCHTDNYVHFLSN